MSKLQELEEEHEYMREELSQVNAENRRLKERIDAMEKRLSQDSPAVNSHDNSHDQVNNKQPIVRSYSYCSMLLN